MLFGLGLSSMDKQHDNVDFSFAFQGLGPPRDSSENTVSVVLQLVRIIFMVLDEHVVIKRPLVQLVSETYQATVA